MSKVVPTVKAASDTIENRREALRAAIELRTHSDQPETVIRRAAMFANWLESGELLPSATGGGQ